MKPANGLWKEAKIAKIQHRVLERLTELPLEVRANKHNMELLSLVCNLIENAGINNKEKGDKLKIDKKQLLIQVYNSLYGSITPADCEILSKNIEFLHDNGHIVKHATWKMVFYCVGDWFKRKVL
jgi:DNA replication protein DnaD